MINERSGVVPFRQVADGLRAEIRTGELAVGDRLPSTRDLADQYGVAITTAVKAVDELRREGLIRTERGLGSFVTAQPTLIRSSEQRYRRRTAQLPDTELRADVGYTVADVELGRRLLVDVGEQLSRVDYHWTTTDGRPLQRSTQWEPLKLTAGTPIEEPDSTGQHNVIERFDSIGLLVDHVDEEINTRMPSTVESAELAIPSGTPVFDIRRTHWAGEVPVETACITIRGDRLCITSRHTVPPAPERG